MTGWSLLFLGMIAASVVITSLIHIALLLGMRRALVVSTRTIAVVETRRLAGLQKAQAFAASASMLTTAMTRRFGEPTPRRDAVPATPAPAAARAPTIPPITAAPSPDRLRPHATRLVPRLSLRLFITLMRQAISAWSADYAASMGAALSYYTLFSLAPLLLIAIALAGIFFGDEAARGQVMATLGGLVGTEGAAAVEEMIKHASTPSTDVLSSIVGVVTLILGATSVFGELQSSLDRIWRAPAQAQRNGIIALLRGRLMSFGLVVSIGFLLLVSLLVSATMAAVGTYGAQLFPGWDVTLQLLNAVVAFAITGAMFAAIYRVLPSVHIPWRDVWTGAWVTALLFTIGKLAIGLYLGKAAVTSAFGAAGSLVVLLIWVYYSAQIFLLGAEFTWAHAQLDQRRALYRPIKPPAA